MRVIGTAGHVDHGKSTLVRQLTGIDPDRLEEEKKREMTIDLGFAWLNLPDGETVGIIDVPGHRDFIENMLAGVGGIDAALLVIAADEGVMPQTQEHLAILDLLGIQNGLIVLTKTDMVDDPEWLDLVEQDVLELLQPTQLADAPILRVSAHTGQGLPELVTKLNNLLHTLPPNLDYHQPRLSIDRIFTVSGFGTVVTGTLLGGVLNLGDEVEIQPGGLRGRIRGLQSYKQTVEQAQPGSRVAINLSGIEKAALKRGQVLTYPRQLQPTLLADVYFRHLPAASRPLKHNAQVKFFVGAAESTGYVRLLNDETLAPGREGWLQIRLDHPLTLAQGDRFILRYPSPSETIGGGLVVNPQPGRRWRRFQASIIEGLEMRLGGTPAERVTQAADQSQPVKRAFIQQETNLTDTELDSALAEAIQTGQIVPYSDGTFLAAVRHHSLLQAMQRELEQFHAANPLRRGLSREQLRSQLGLKQITLTHLLDSQTTIVAAGNLLYLDGHEIRFNPAQQTAVNMLQAQFAVAPFTPPSYQEATQLVGEDVLLALIERGDIIQVQADIIFAAETYQEMLAGVLAIIDQHGEITTGQLRDHFQTSRKYAIGLLEHFDQRGITRRTGDSRVRGPQAGA